MIWKPLNCGSILDKIYHRLHENVLVISLKIVNERKHLRPEVQATTSTSSFMVHRRAMLLTRVHDDIKLLVPWKWDRFPYFGPLHKRSLRFLLKTILRTPVTIWRFGVYRNSESQQEQHNKFWQRLSHLTTIRTYARNVVSKGVSFHRRLATSVKMFFGNLRIQENVNYGENASSVKMQIRLKRSRVSVMFHWITMKPVAQECYNNRERGHRIDHI